MSNDAYEPTRVDITNVAKWFAEVNEKDIYTWAADFPVMASPWPVTEYIWRQPSYYNVNGEKRRASGFAGTHRTTVIQGEVRSEAVIDGSLLDQFPAFIHLLTGRTLKLPRNAHGIFQDYVVDCMVTTGVECKWAQLILWNMHAPSGVLGVMWIQFLDRNGCFIGGEDNGPLLLSASHERLVSTDAATVLYPLMFALSLVNCKNVKVVDIPASRQQRRMAERKGQPVITYKELIIDAFRNQVRQEAQGAGGNEIKRALHICRGHFATYGDDNPLFGKHTGMFWRPMHMRGHKESGQVHKTYKVESPPDGR